MSTPIGKLRGQNEMTTAADLRQERLFLETRLKAIREGLNEVQKENSLLKMKSTIALGQMKLQVESTEDDEQFFIQKCLDLQKKVQDSEESLQSKTNELATLQSMMQQEAGPT